MSAYAAIKLCINHGRRPRLRYVGYQGSDVPTLTSIRSPQAVCASQMAMLPAPSAPLSRWFAHRTLSTKLVSGITEPYRLNKDVEPGVPTTAIISERLKELGYTTGLFGKTHDVTAEAMMPFNRWDDYYGLTTVHPISSAT